MRKTTSFLLQDAIHARYDRDDFFRNGLDYLQNNAIAGQLNGRPFRFHWNINLYIDMTARCNGKCRFCINSVNFSRTDIPDEKFIMNLEKTLKMIRFIDPSIQIVGGEPTINPERLKKIIDLIKMYNMRKPVLGTNGSGILNSNLLDYIEPVIDHMNISRHHFDDEKLNRLMGFSNPLNNSALHGIMKKHPIAKKTRFNCCLLKDNIDSFEKMKQYIEWALEMGVGNLCFSTLSKLPKDYVYTADFIEQSKIYSIDFNAIMAKINEDPGFSFIKFHTGSHCMYEVWEYRNGSRSCMVVYATSNNNFARDLDSYYDLIELLVFHCDGVLAGSWNRNCKVLFEN
jgi:MoaA/NifB/PqqE/SkfB family radical SAM enzyme